jgi:phosphoglycolate phosphatase-like HAD superfamily hydrolase
MLLLLFDIDGTLLQGAAHAHADALRSALHTIHEIGASDGAAEAYPSVQAAGRTDMDIARELALRCGCSEEIFQGRMGELQAACLLEYERRVPADLSSFAVPGMPELLAELHADPDVQLSLVTGNLEGIARLKLARAGLGAFFTAGHGGFGSDSEDRNELPRIARERAGVGGEPHPRELTVVIGDTPRDIACARADGVRCIAVSTGPYDADALREADAVADGPAQLRELIAQLGTSRL